MSNIILKDTFSINDNINLKGESSLVHTKVTAEIKKKDGTTLFRDLGSNATVIGGVQDYVKSLWNIQSSDLLQFTNLDSEFTGLPTPTYTSDQRKIFGYGLGIDGATGSTIHTIKRHTKGYNKDQLVSFQTINTGLDDVNSNLSKYVFRVLDGGDAMYYIKKIVPEYKVISAVGQVKIPDNPTTTYTGTEDVRSHIRIRTSIETDEVVRWFGKKFGTVDNAYVNSIILFAGRPCRVTINGTTYNTYRDIIATNKLNFLNLELNGKEVVISYDLYFV